MVAVELNGVEMDVVDGGDPVEVVACVVKWVLSIDVDCYAVLSVAG